MTIKRRIWVSLIFFSVILPGTTYASDLWKGCESEIQALVEGTKDEEILRLNKNLLHRFQLANCSDYGSNDYTAALIVAVHEGVHFLDLGYNEMDFDKIQDAAKNVKNPEVRFYFPNDKFYQPKMTRFPIPLNKLESTKSVLERYWQRSDTPSLNQMSEVFQDFYKTYVSDTEALASSNLFAGGGTEFNAYTHGTISATHYSKIKGKLILSLPVQRSGTIFFATIFSTYLAQLRYEQGDAMVRKNFNTNALIFQSALFMNAAEALKISNYCKTLFKTDLALESDLLKVTDPFVIEQVTGSNLLNEVLACSNSDRSTARDIIDILINNVIYVDFENTVRP